MTIRGTLSTQLALPAVCAILIFLVGCSRSEAPTSEEHTPAPAADDPLADAPDEWRPFIDWADGQLRRSISPVPLPTNPRLPERTWPVTRLDEMLDNADIGCHWQAAMSSSEPLATLGPLRTDIPDPNLRVKRRRHPALGLATVLVLSGFQVERDEVGSIAIDIRVPYGKHFDLIWAGGGKIRVPLPDNQKLWPLRIATDGLTPWHGPLNEVRLRMDGVGDGTIEIRSLRFLPRQDAFPQPTGARRVELERESRDAVYVHCPATLRFADVRLPERARLQVGLGHVFPAKSRPPRPDARASAGDDATSRVTDFEILVESDDQQTQVLKKRLEPGEHWSDVSVSLGPWSGQTVSLTLRAISGTIGSIALWANPVVYQPVDNAPCTVLYLIDALAAKHLDLYGYARPTAPNISALATEGVWFARNFCNSPVTVSSVPDILLSMPTEQHGVYAASITVPRKLVTLADALRAAGFATALFSTNGHAGPRQNTDQGFDYFTPQLSPGWKGVADRTVPLEAVKRWLEVHSDRPTFLYIHTAEPHLPYIPPPGFAGRFDPDYSGAVDGTFDANGPRGISAAQRQRDITQLTALYDEEVAYADMRFGLFRDLLRELHIHERANIFVIADHGEELFEHGHWGHGRSLHTEVLHIPLVIAGPLVTARGRVDTPTQLHDIMPTVLDLFDLPAPYELRGNSLLPFLQPEGQPVPQILTQRLIFHSHHNYFGLGIVQYAVIERGRWKLMYFYDTQAAESGNKPTRFSLYDLQDFFYDRADVIDAHRDVARRLIGELLAYRERQHPYDRDLPDEALELDPEQIRDLQALGYLGSDEDEDE